MIGLMAKNGCYFVLAECASIETARLDWDGTLVTSNRLDLVFADCYAYQHTQETSLILSASDTYKTKCLCWKRCFVLTLLL